MAKQPKKCEVCGTADLRPSGLGCLNPDCHNYHEKWPKVGTMYAPPRDPPKAVEPVAETPPEPAPEPVPVAEPKPEPKPKPKAKPAAKKAVSFD